MRTDARDNRAVLMFAAGVAGWVVPGGGYVVLKEYSRAAIIFVCITLTFAAGLYIGSIGVVDPVGAKLWYAAQILCSPFVAALGRITAAGQYTVYGKPAEIGQIYTSIAGLLNLLCIVNAVYMAYADKPPEET
jgi:hypothetical protein